MRPSRRLVALVLVGLIAAGVAWAFAPEGPERLRARAEAATRAGDWPAALARWRALNRTRLARGRTFLAEARACLALDRAAQAERALRRAIAADPADPEPWRLLLEVLRVEDRVAEVGRLGWAGAAAVPPSARRDVLREMTLALLADVPDDHARALLDRWIAADPADIDARVARLRRGDAASRPDDPGHASRIAELTAWLDRDSNHLGARAALVAALADAGEPGRGRALLDAWPDDARDDVRYWRLRGRWELDHEHTPDRAVASFRRVLAELPHDWKTHYRLARALQALGRSAEARQAAEVVGRLREVLDPATLGPRLAADLGRLDDPRSLRDLADLCARVGLGHLAEAWRREAARGPRGRGEGPDSLGKRVLRRLPPAIKSH